MTAVKAQVITDKQAKAIVAAVKRVGILDVYRKWYEYLRPILKERFDRGSRTTPYAPSSIGQKKRSGEVIGAGSLYNRDTDALYESVTRNVKLDAQTGIEIRSDVPYAGFALKRFTEKGGLAPEGLLSVSRDDIGELETILLKEYEAALGEIPDDLI